VRVYVYVRATRMLDCQL